jgi:mono/diheme cytochrome c family protein
LLFLSFSVSPTAQRGGARRRRAGASVDRQSRRHCAGEKLYNETCTACHGKDGTGGELGPPVAAQNRRYLKRTDPEIFDTIKNGIQGTQMPPYATQFTDDQIWQMTAYIHGLRGTAVDTPASGNVANGETIFWGKGTCGGCHMIKAKGSILGPDLSNSRAPARCRTSSTRSRKNSTRSRPMAAPTTRRCCRYNYQLFSDDEDRRGVNGIFKTRRGVAAGHRQGRPEPLHFRAWTFRSTTI